MIDKSIRQTYIIKIFASSCIILFQEVHQCVIKAKDMKLKESKTKFIKLKEEGYILSKRSDPTGIGYTWEF